MAKHGIAESTKLQGCMNVSFVATEDVDNGSIVAMVDWLLVIQMSIPLPSQPKQIRFIS